MVRSGTWSREQALEARRGTALWLYIDAVMQGEPDSACMR